MNNYIQPGKTVTVAAPAEVVSGDLVVVGSIVGVANYSAASGADVAQGDKLYWDASAKRLTKTAGTGSKKLVGLARAAAGTSATTVDCLLMLTGQTGGA